jgi:hypothetical protein
MSAGSIRCSNNFVRWPTIILRTHCAASITDFRTSAIPWPKLHQGVSKSHPAARVWAWSASVRRAISRRAIALSIPTRIASVMFQTESTASVRPISWAADTFIRRRIAARVSRVPVRRGCHHEAYVRYGDTGHPNLHYCDWIRGWTDTCLQIYGRHRRAEPEFPGAFLRKESRMRHLRAVNQKARRIDDYIASLDEDVVALQGPGQGGRGGNPANPLSQRPHVPLGCSLVFSPGWEVDSAGGTAGLCQPVERDLLRLLRHLLLARAGSGSPQQLSGLDREVRGRDERLAQYRFGFSMRIVLFLATAAACAAQGLLFVGTWPKQVQVIDEAKQKVIDHIELKTGTPRSLSLSEDRKTLYVTTTDHNGIEVVDVATRKVTNSSC